MGRHAGDIGAVKQRVGRRIDGVAKIDARGISAVGEGEREAVEAVVGNAGLEHEMEARVAIERGRFAQ